MKILEVKQEIHNNNYKLTFMFRFKEFHIDKGTMRKSFLVLHIKRFLPNTFFLFHWMCYIPQVFWKVYNLEYCEMKIKLQFQFSVRNKIASLLLKSSKGKHRIRLSSVINFHIKSSKGFSTFRDEIAHNIVEFIETDKMILHFATGCEFKHSEK